MHWGIHGKKNFRAVFHVAKSRTTETQNSEKEKGGQTVRLATQSHIVSLSMIEALFDSMAANSEIKWHLYSSHFFFCIRRTTKCDERTKILHLRLLHAFFFQHVDWTNAIDSMRTESQFRARTCLPVSYYKNATGVAPVHRDVTKREGDQCAVAPPLLTSRGRSLATIGYFSHREACRAYTDAA